MIYGQFKDENYAGDLIEKIRAFLSSNDMSKLEDGKHIIDGDKFFVNIASYSTTNEENRVWEAHRKYIDVHMMIEGEEIIKHSFLDSANIVKYHEDSDYVEIDKINIKSNDILLKQGQYLICYPQDVHKTACIIDKETKVRKAIFKIAL